MASIRSSTTTTGTAAAPQSSNKPTHFSSADNIFGPHHIPPLPSQQAPSAVKPDAFNQRRLSLPDLSKLKDEWAQQEALQGTSLPPGKLQVSSG
jgi:hypothetical protein